MFVIDTATAHTADEIADFALGDDDVIVVGFPKSGTSWLQIMVANLWDDLHTCGGNLRKVPSLHGRSVDADGVRYYGYADCVTLESPRLIKTHLPRGMMPTRWPEHGKVVHITRNPKDVCVSFFFELYYMQRRTAPGSEVGVDDFAEHFSRFVAGNVPWGPYVENIVSWREFDNPNLFKLTYEEARRNTRDVLGRIVDFVGRPIAPGRIEEVVTKTKFESMRKSEIRLQINHPDIREDTAAPFMRKGVVGDWRNMFTVAQNEIFDRTIVSRLEAHGVYLDYE
jgi:hypothetical protein